jgi:hypothetical protein
MTDLRMIRASLDRVRQQILASPVFVSGRPDSEAKATDEAKRLETILKDLNVVIRDLRSSENLVLLRESQLRKVPHQQRYSAQQSLRQMAENIRALGTDARALADLLKDLLDRNGLLNSMQKAKNFIDLADDLEKVSGHQMQHLLREVLYPKQDILSPAPAAHPTATLADVAGLIAFAYLALKALQRKWSSKA